ncbi:S9 family peptidase [Nakamurella sp. GG22]
MQPHDLNLLRVPGRPALGADGSVVVAVAAPDLEANLYRGKLYRFGPPAGTGSAGESQPTELTLGPRDSDPVISPDGRLVIFRRAPESGPAQLFAMPLDGGEPHMIAEHPLGAGPVVFSPEGDRVLYTAPVPEPGRYGTDDKVDGGAEPPRPIGRLSYRLDGEGFVLDKPAQLFVLDLDAETPPVQLTDEPSGVRDPAFTGDGRVMYVRPTGIDELTDEIAVVDIPADLGPDSDRVPTTGDRLVAAAGSAALPVAADGEVYFLGVEFTGIDSVGRTVGLWAAHLTGGVPRRLTDEESVHVDGVPGRPQVVGDRVVVAVLDRGAVGLRSVPANGDRVVLADLPVVIGGARVVTSFAGRDSTVAAVVAAGDSAGEVVTIGVDPTGSGTGERLRSDFGGLLAASGIRPAIEIGATAPDGYPVHGWLVAPDGPGPHPTLLVVHGGPHAAYGPALFDEAQVYAAAGYAVVLGNPSGSAGYGEPHGRAVVGALGTVDVDDLLALLDAALARPDCDAERVGVMGGSYGGFMTSLLCSRAPERFVAAISERAVNAWDSFAGSSDIGYYFAAAYVGADRDSQWAASPLSHADEIDVPLLIIHSEQDWRCPVEQAQRLFVALKSRGAEVEMLLFPGEGHELSRSGRPRHREQRFEAILDWWGRHLPSGS